MAYLGHLAGEQQHLQNLPTVAINHLLTGMIFQVYSPEV